VSERDILDQIDDVITWHGSPDSMTWTVEPPKFPGLSAVDAERAQQAAAIFGSHVRTLVEAMQPAFERMMRDLGSALQTLTGIAPQMEELAEANRQVRRAMKSEYARRRRRRTGRK
jgi:hypothetical protein